LSEPPTPDGDLFHEETDDPLLADRRNFFKVELWTRDGLQIERCCLRATAWIRRARCSAPSPRNGRVPG
jgi:hypothetical protein